MAHNGATCSILIRNPCLGSEHSRSSSLASNCGTVTASVQLWHWLADRIFVCVVDHKLRSAKLGSRTTLLGDLLREPLRRSFWAAPAKTRVFEAR